MFHNFDNGMLHLTVMKAVGLSDGDPGYEQCKSIYFSTSGSNAKNELLYMHFVGCARTHIRLAMQGNHARGISNSVRIISKAQGLSRDDLSREWNRGIDLMIHGVKMALPYQYRANITHGNCATLSFLNPAKHVPILRLRAGLKHALTFYSSYRPAAFLYWPPFSSCYPRCPDPSIYSPSKKEDTWQQDATQLPVFHLFPSEDDFRCYWLRYQRAHLANYTSWNKETYLQVHRHYYLGGGRTLGLDPLCTGTKWKKHLHTLRTKLTWYFHTHRGQADL
jgi:hypothetical protein